MPRVFLDTNILVYASDRRDVDKHQTALRLVHTLIASQEAVVSTQVLQEFSATMLQKIGVSDDVVRQAIALLLTGEVVSVDAELIDRTITLRSEYQINYWDACIIAAAEQAGCQTLYSEDLNAGQSYAGVTVQNPFAPASPGNT